MKHFYTKVLLLVAVFSFMHTIYAQEVKYYNTVIAFLKETPKTSVNGCTFNDLMNLLTEESLKWVESIECSNVNFYGGNAGIEMMSIDENKLSSIKINFKRSNSMKVYRCNPFLVYRDESIPVKFEINNESYSYTGSIDAQAETIMKYTNQGILNIMTGTTAISKPFFYTGNPITNTSLESLQIIIPYQNGNPKIQFYGFKIFYTGTEDLSEVETAVEDLEAEQGIKVYEYYDLMGRRLPEAPNGGIYVRKCGGKVEKLIANGR